MRGLVLSCISCRRAAPVLDASDPSRKDGTQTIMHIGEGKVPCDGFVVRGLNRVYVGFVWVFV